MRILNAALLYGLAMFAAGFALGTVRELVVVPLWGVTRPQAEMIELPLMLSILAVASFWLVRRRSLRRGEALLAGLGGAALLAALDVFLVGMGMRGLDFRTSLASLDPRTGTLFPYALAIAAMLPLLAALLRRKRDS
jgi:vacuolar-type H+-ATPase subunit I/STV1